MTLCTLDLVWPLRPPGLSAASRMRSSLSMRPALRKALETRERLPEGGAELDKDMDHDCANCEKDEGGSECGRRQMSWRCVRRCS